MRTNLEVYCVAHPDPNTWIVYFPWTKNPLPMNGSHGHPKAHARKAKGIRQQAHTMIAHARIPHLGRCTAKVTQYYTINRVRDVDNLGELAKRLFDALVDAGVVDDDRPELMTKHQSEIKHIRDSDGMLTAAGFTLTVTRIPEGEA